jgi:hypothetical protein
MVQNDPYLLETLLRRPAWLTQRMHAWDPGALDGLDHDQLPEEWFFFQGAATVRCACDPPCGTLRHLVGRPDPKSLPFGALEYLQEFCRALGLEAVLRFGEELQVEMWPARDGEVSR